MKYFQDGFLENSDEIKISSTDKELKEQIWNFQMSVQQRCCG